jgi:hypothetical protein
VGEVVNIDEMVQEKGLEKTLEHLEEWLGTLQAQIDMIELLVKGLR